jgi:hypothetical protein
MQAITVRDRDTTGHGFTLTDLPYPPLIGAVRPLAETPAALAPGRRIPGRTIIAIA